MFVINSSLTIFSTLYILIALECGFAYLFVQSDGVGFTLASKRWSCKHWNPINSYGYRDYEPEWKDKLIFVVGDSFVAGHGIKNINDRFSNILSKKLGSSWCVTILAQNGWGPQDYIKALTSHEKKPDVILVSYFINDIESSASINGIITPQFSSLPNKLVRPFVDYSYLFNWIYWRVYRGDIGSTPFLEYLKRSYTDDNVWKTHTQELNALIAYADQTDAKIIFIIWPFLKDVDGSKYITSKIFKYLKNKGVMAFNLSKHFEKRDPDTLIVNSLDAHPNVAVNAEISQLLYEALLPLD